MDLMQLGQSRTAPLERCSPTVRGSVMKTNDAHGGGEGKAPVGRKRHLLPWGKPRGLKNS